MTAFFADHLPALLVGLAIAAIGAPLSVFVVLKRLAFIGQGVSHAAFGGVGVALALGFAGSGLVDSVMQSVIVLGFSIGAAMAISALGRANKGRIDTAIGIVLSASMALGFILFLVAESRHDHDHLGHAHGDHADEHHVIEEILFGNILDAGWGSLWVTLIAGVLILSTLWWHRHKLVFWSFDEGVCATYGTREHFAGNLLLILLAVTVVLAMQIVGVILAAAILVLPGAAALHLGGRLRAVIAWSLVVGVGGTLLGFVLAEIAGWPVGPGIVVVQSGAYLAALVSTRAGGVLRSA